MSETQDIDLDDLLLDAENPRLPTTVGRQQSTMLAYIAKTTSIAEIMSAIAENDYFPGEPLIVVPAPRNKYTVIEGNRRLTALKLLSEPELLPRSRKVQEIAADADYRPISVPCVVFQSREEVVNYLGYRHITGVKQWEPLAKARYIAGYFDNHTDPSDAPSDRYSEVARGIGSNGPYIKRQLDGLAVYRVIEQREFFNIDDLDEENVSFSLLSTSVGYQSILDFVSDDPHPYVNDDELNVENIHFLAKWMFEQDDDGATVLGDSRNIQKLALIVADEEALASLKAGDSLDKAYSLTRGLADDFTAILSAAETFITRAVSMVAVVEVDESHRNRISKISKQARLLRQFAEDE